MGKEASILDARLEVDRLLAEAVRLRASDVHVEPTAAGCEVRYRIDGLLRPVARHEAAAGRSLVNRLMVMGQLLTYRMDVPQEGRIHWASNGMAPIEMRLAIMPTTHGPRAAVRLPADLLRPGKLEELGLGDRVVDGLMQFVRAESGMLAVVGPAGSGKTTTIYAILEKIVDLSPGLSVIALEDPVERDLPGVTQIEVSAFGELTYERALRSILRQDPQVLMLGEIRDAATASLAIQAALSGHRLICTLHAGDPAGAVARLLEMGVEPYQVTSALYGILAQRLLRKRSGEGYEGRVPVAELATMGEAMRKAILARADVAELRAAYEGRGGHVTLCNEARRLLEAGVTDAAEIERVLGIRMDA